MTDATKRPDHEGRSDGKGERGGEASRDTIRDEAETVTTFYNGDCPVCSREIGHYRRVADRRPAALEWRDLASDPEALARYGVTPEDARRRLHVIDEAGRVRSGVDAFVAVWRNLPGYRHLAGVVSLPLVRPFAALAYEGVAVPALAALNARRARRAQPRS